MATTCRHPRRHRRSGLQKHRLGNWCRTGLRAGPPNQKWWRGGSGTHPGILIFRNDGQKRVLIDINRVVREVLELAQGELLKHHISVEIELNEELPTVTADRIQLQQVIMNLTTNAIDAMQSVTDRPRDLRAKSGCSTFTRPSRIPSCFRCIGHRLARAARSGATSWRRCNRH